MRLQHLQLPDVDEEPGRLAAAFKAQLCFFWTQVPGSHGENVEVWGGSVPDPSICLGIFHDKAFILGEKATVQRKPLVKDFTLIHGDVYVYMGYA